MDCEHHQYRFAELPTLLLEATDLHSEVWARAVLLRTLETRGSVRYRHWDRLKDQSMAEMAACSLRSAYRLLRQRERELFVLVMLLVHWESVRRSTGLSLGADKVVRLLSDEAGNQACCNAVETILMSGDRAVKNFGFEGVLEEEDEKNSGTEIVFDAESGKVLGVREATFEFGRVQIAILGFNAVRWESNIRAFIPWWLTSLGELRAKSEIPKLLRQIDKNPKGYGEQYRLLGLADWATANPGCDHYAATLKRCLAASNGSIRKTGMELAMIAGEYDILRQHAATDPDQGVRKRAEKLLASLASTAGKQKRLL